MDSGSDDGGQVAECSEILLFYIYDDTTVGPGCVRVYRTDGSNGATLTILHGTTILMEADDYLQTGFHGQSSLVAIGMDDAPIRFTSYKHYVI